MPSYILPDKKSKISGIYVEGGWNVLPFKQHPLDVFHQEDVGILFPHLVKKPIVRDLKPGADGVTIKVPKLGQYHIVVKKEGYVTHKENVTVTCLPNCTLGNP